MFFKFSSSTLYIIPWYNNFKLIRQQAHAYLVLLFKQNIVMTKFVVQVLGIRDTMIQYMLRQK